MHTMHTPLGKLTAHPIPQDTQSILLAGEYHGQPFHIYTTQPGNPSQLDYPFYIQILNNLPRFIAQAEQQLRTSLRQPENGFQQIRPQSSPAPQPNSHKTRTTGHSTLPNAHSPSASPTASSLPLNNKKSSAGKTCPNPMKSAIKQPMPAKSSLRSEAELRS